MPFWFEPKGTDMSKVKKPLVAGFEVFSDGGGIINGQGEKLFNIRPFEEIPGLDHFHPDPDMKSVPGGLAVLFMVLGRQKIEVFGLKPAFGGGFPKSGLAEEEGLPA
jgi:hypothetical protein